MGNFYAPKPWNIPLCFPTPEAYGRWREWARACKAGINGDSYCADCTPGYQQRMANAGKCEHPDTSFKLDDDGEVRGYRAVPIFPKPYRREIPSPKEVAR